MSTASRLPPKLLILVLGMCSATLFYGVLVSITIISNVSADPDRELLS